MSDFGDFDPEDAWDDSDPPEVKLRLLAKIIENIRNAEGSPERRQVRTDNVRRLLAKLNNNLGDF